MKTGNYDVLFAEGGKPVKMWTQGVAVDAESKAQLLNAAKLPFIYKWIAVMPDVHTGKGATVGSVIPTKGAIIPAAVGVDIGCGMMAVAHHAERLGPAGQPRAASAAQSRRAVPHGRTPAAATRARGIRRTPVPSRPGATCTRASGRICAKHPKLAKTNHLNHLGTLGTGNHFIEVCLDEEERVWFMLHSGSRGVGNAIGSLLHRARQGGHAALVREPPRPGSGLLPGRHRALRRLRRGGGVGAGLRPDEPRGDDGERCCRRCAAPLRSRSRRRWRR